MEILLLSITAILIIIVVKLIKIEKNQVNLSKSHSFPMKSSSLNPLFSEEEITTQKNIAAKWQSRVEVYFNLLQQFEKDEIDNHHASGRAKIEFKPSIRLKSILLEEAFALVGRNATENIPSQMIEANISIINGKSIAEASEQFYKKKSNIPWNNVDLSVHAWQSEPIIKKMFDENLKQRNEFWLNSWDYILEKDYLAKE